MKTATSTVQITVNRNPSPPVFTSPACQVASFAETSPQGSAVFQLSASDNDAFVSNDNLSNY